MTFESTDLANLTPAQLRELADRIESQECTGWIASWCPVHGDCRGCLRDEETHEWLEFSLTCPLHSERSSHGCDA